MPVPNDEIVCHFIKQSDWSEVSKAPKAKSLKQKDMSVWHPGRLATQGATLDNLRFREFAGAGKLMLTPSDYFAIAEKVASKTGAHSIFKSNGAQRMNSSGQTGVLGVTRTPKWRCWTNP